MGEGLLFETYREGWRYRWRIVLGSDAPVGEFFEALGEEVDECTGIEMLRLTELDPERSHDAGNEGIPEEQRTALRAAVERGYYETPRRIDLSELADELGIPRSTLSYRLRRAEAALATSFAGSKESIDRLAARL